MGLSYPQECKTYPISLYYLRENLLSIRCLVALQQKLLHCYLLRGWLGSKVQLVEYLDAYSIDNIMIVLGYFSFPMIDLDRSGGHGRSKINYFSTHATPLHSKQYILRSKTAANLKPDAVWRVRAAWRVPSWCRGFELDEGLRM
jgi:hypothetical protein